jgi:long-chain acyl-CoA synthetase
MTATTAPRAAGTSIPSGMRARPGSTTLPGLLLDKASSMPTRVALRHSHLSRWEETTWEVYAARAARVGLGLAALGVRPGERVAIHSENRPEWVIADIGAQGIGAASVGIYPTSPAAEVQYLLGHSRSVLLIAEDEEQLDKVLAVRDRLPELRHIVVIDTRGVKRHLSDPMIMTFAALEELGGSEPRAVERWADSVAAIDPSSMALIVYTSGTTGPPKGAVLTHANLIAATESFSQAFEATPMDEVLSYLPLCHIAERLNSVINALHIGYVVNFGKGGESFTNDLREVQPTLFLGVPRVWEKMKAAMETRVADATWLKNRMYWYWLRRGERMALRRMHDAMTPFDRFVAWVGYLLLYRSVRDKLGLRRVRIAMSGSAPISPKVLEYFWAIGVGVREGYGQTENTALATFTPAGDVRIGSVGVALPGVELAIAEDGEILTRSAANFAGYLDNPEATAATLDADGWLRTGDIGELDADGYLKITDRKKDLIITAGGKKVSPSELENMLKVSPFVREAVVIGDRRKYLTALIGIELDTVGDWATRRFIAYTTYDDLASKPEVRDLIGEWVDRVNRDLAQAETIKRFALMPRELGHENGQLTATQKVKRAAVAAEFDDLIDAMYEGDAT